MNQQILNSADFEKLRKIAPNFLANYHAMRTGVLTPRSIPEEIAFKLTNRCDLRCQHCYQWNETGYHRQLATGVKSSELDLAIIAKVLAATHTCKSNVYLWGGEPLLYRDWQGLMALLEQDKRWTTICTNGSLIAKRLDSLLSLSNQLELSISLDGFQTEHDQLRGQGSFTKAVDGLRLLVKQKREGVYQGEITVNFLVTDATVKHILSFVEWLGQEGIDTLYVSLPWFLSIKANQNMDSYYQHHHLPMCSTPSWYAYNHRISAELIPDLARALQQLKQRQHHCKLRFNPEIDENELESFINGSDQAIQNKKHCLAILTRMDVFPDGEVISCKFFPEFRMGNLAEHDMIDVWLGEKFQAHRHRLSEHGLMPVCAKCNLLYTRGI